MSGGSAIMVSLRVAATPDRAFDTFTGEIGVWWRSNEMFEFRRGRSGRLAFEPGENGRLTESYTDGSVFEIGRITAWEPGVRLAFTWRQEDFSADQMTHVEVRFEPVGEPLGQETRITVEHRGWDSVPQDHVARHGMADGAFLRQHGHWWQALLGSVALRCRPAAR